MSHGGGCKDSCQYQPFSINLVCNTELEIQYTQCISICKQIYTNQEMLCEMVSNITENCNGYVSKIIESIQYYTYKNGIIINGNDPIRRDPNYQDRVNLIAWDHIPPGYTAETIKYVLQSSYSQISNDSDNFNNQLITQFTSQITDQFTQINRYLSLISQRLMIQNGKSIDKLKQFVESNLCIICMDRPKNMTTEPCNHCEFCEECVQELIKCGKTSCPMCRQANVKYEKINI
jgi:hypothetical protein